MTKCVLAIDQGTTSSRCMIFDQKGRSLGSGQIPFEQHYPQPGWVEHNAEEIFSSVVQAMKDSLENSAISPERIGCIGITNQRETTVVWDKRSGKPVYPAIVWQCRRTANICEQWKSNGWEDIIREKTGLVIDAYFSASKIKWILDTVPGARTDAEAGNLLFGTIDAWLIYKLTDGKCHATDYSNASRTMLFDIEKLCWSEELCERFSIPIEMLPRAVPSCSVFGEVAPGISGIESLSGVSISGVAGDQAAALFGQMCLKEGDVKNTYGTGCFALMNTGKNKVSSKNGLLSSVAWSYKGETVYALEGSVFHAGSIISWMKDELGLISTPRECDELAESIADNGGVYLVPAFSGLGAPYWDMYARGCLVGMTRGTGRAQIARAAIESIAFQVYDLIELMKRDSGYEINSIKADGGVSISNFLMQFQADLLGVPVDRSVERESTSKGVAFMAGLTSGLWADIQEVERLRVSDRIFIPSQNALSGKEKIAQWQRAVKRASGWVVHAD